MPILFENRLSNSVSDKRLRKVYHFHHILWTFYYAIFMAGFGFGAAALVGIKGDPIFAAIIAAITTGALALFFKRQLRRRKRR